MHQSFNRTTTCINILAYYSFWPYHNITPTLHMQSHNNNKYRIQDCLLHVTCVLSYVLGQSALTRTPLDIIIWTKPTLDLQNVFHRIFLFSFHSLFNDLYTSLLGLDLRNYFQQPSWIYRIDLTISIGICILHGSQSYSLRVLRKSSGFHLCRWLIKAYFNQLFLTLYSI